MQEVFRVLDCALRRRPDTAASPIWRSFDELLGRRGVPVTVIDATNLHRHFDDKVAGVRAATAGVEPPTFTSVPVGCVLRIFSPITPADVEALVQSLPDKHCMSHPLPTWLLKKNADVLAPFLCRLFNWSMAPCRRLSSPLNLRRYSKKPI